MVSKQFRGKQMVFVARVRYVTIVMGAGLWASIAGPAIQMGHRRQFAASRATEVAAQNNEQARAVCAGESA